MVYAAHLQVVLTWEWFFTGFPTLVSALLSLWLFVTKLWKSCTIEIDDQHDDCLFNMDILQLATLNNQRACVDDINQVSNRKR